ncbi:MAG: hypothetical protein ACK2TV_04525 [Anaerolineales bacterium]
MENCYWTEWERFLAHRQMKSFACSFLAQTRPLLPILAQFMVIGFPIFKALPLGGMYSALMDTFGDEDTLVRFTRYLEGDNE